MSEIQQDNTALELLGFDTWFQEQSKGQIKDNFSAARVTEVNRERYMVSYGGGSSAARLSGRFLFNVEKSIDYPTIGDWVVTEISKDKTSTVIHSVLPRKSLLKRKTAGKDVEFQLIAANIDYACVIQSVDSNFDLNRLERYLVMVNESEIEPIVVLSKTDLMREDELAAIMDRLDRFEGRYLLMPISNVAEDGIKELQNRLKPNHTYCLLGSSGVGKTTLINKLLGEDMLEVKEVREKDSKGMHTTTKRQLIRLNSGAIFIDTPGMRELGNFDVGAGLEETFDEIAEHGRNCKFNDCTHMHEKDCAVMAAVEQGVIDENSYENYLKIQQESAHYETSYLDKKRKDKSFGKMRKRYSKQSKKHQSF